MKQNIKKKKVLVLLPGFDLGGAEKQGFYIARSLKESGNYNVEVWGFLKGSGLLLDRLETENIKTRILEIPFSTFQNRTSRIKTYWNFIFKLREAQFDIIIPFTYQCNVLAASTFRFAGVKKCIWFQIAMEHHLPFSTFEKIATKFKPIYAANSSSAADFIAKRHSISQSNVKFIPNPFERSEAKNDVLTWRKKLDSNSDDIIMVMAANFFSEKDHDTLIIGLKSLLENHKNLMLVFAGGPLNSGKANQLKALAFDLKLQDKIKFIGSTDDIPGLLKAANIGILSSRSEGSPNSLIEYMGYELPIVACNIPPIIELLGADYPFLFKVEDINDFIYKTENLLLKLNTLDDLIKKNQETVDKIYTKENNYLAFNEIIKH